jgi:hypothetical protein
MITSSQKNSFAIYYDGCLYNFSLLLLLKKNKAHSLHIMSVD